MDIVGEAVTKTPRVRPAREGDLVLARRAREGSSTALAELYRRYADDVHRIAYRLTGSESDAEDVLQDVFLGLPEALRTYAGRGGLGAWLRRVATRTSLMRLRAARRRREVAFDERDGRGGLVQGGPTDQLTLEQAIAALPEILRVVFIMRAVEGYPHAEIAKLLGIGIAASKVRFHRARRRLRQYLERA